MADPYLASNEFPGDGVTTLYNISFKGNRPDAGSGVVPYLNPADVKAQVVTPATATTAEVVVDVAIVYVGPNQFRVTPATPAGKITRIYRATQDEYALVDYQALQTVGEADLDLSNRQVIFVVQEAHDLAMRASVDATDAGEIAASAVVTANTAVTTANSALTTASGSNAIAQNALTTANAAVTTAGSAQTAAAAAVAAAASATAAAEDASDAAASVVGIATTANTTANNAVTIANAATTTANGIAGTANTALTNANTAVTTANTANATANAIAGTANSALTTANAANTTAGNAQTAAAGAVTTANAAAAAVSGKQDASANLNAFSALTGASDRLPYFTGAGALSLATLTAFARTLLDDADAATMRATLGMNTPDVAYRRDNIRGTVTMSSSVPTGALIENSSNANGTILKYADGTMICYGLSSGAGVTWTAGTGVRYAAITGTFPATFTSVPFMAVGGRGSDISTLSAYVASVTASTSGWTGFLAAPGGTTGTSTMQFNYIAIGRWAT